MRGFNILYNYSALISTAALSNQLKIGFQVQCLKDHIRGTVIIKIMNTLCELFLLFTLQCRDLGMI